MTTAQPEPITCYRCVELPVARATGNADAQFLDLGRIQP